MNLQILLEHSSDGGYTMTVPASPGCISEGKTREGAITNIEEAVALYLEAVSAD
jgi:predicted RNase H-like HicB family nuclease